MNCNGCKWKNNERACNACRDKATDPAANVEPTSRHESLAKKKSQGLDTRYNIHVHSRTNRLSDPDGRSVKAVIDGIVKAGILSDDSAEFVKEVTQSQEKVKGDEETIITIKTLDK